jgi:hypothetical protein
MVVVGAGVVQDGSLGSQVVVLVGVNVVVVGARVLQASFGSQEVTGVEVVTGVKVVAGGTVVQKPGSRQHGSGSLKSIP